MKPSKKIDITKEVVKKVESGQIKMRARWTFLAKKIGLESGILLGIVVIIVFLSFGLSFWQQYGLSNYFSLGLWGWKKVLFYAPFEIIGIVVLAVVVINYLIRKSEWGYRRSWIFWTGIILVIALPASYTITKLHTTYAFHQNLNKMQKSLGFPGYMQRRIKELDKTVVLGRIEKIIDQKLTIRDDKTQIHNLVSDEVQVKPRYYTPKGGDRVVLIGEWEDNYFQIQALVSYDLIKQRFEQE